LPAILEHVLSNTLQLYILCCWHRYWQSVALQPESCLGRLIFEVARSHTVIKTHTHTHTVRLPYVNDQLVAGTATYVIHWTRDEHPCHRRDSNPRSQQSSNCRVRP